MSVKKFKFVSPGVFVKEVDRSQRAEQTTPAGPIIIGRLPQGPSMRPVKIDSFSQFIQVFGNPVAGREQGDVWRDGNRQGPTYASYAAQAYLAANVGSVNIMRLSGQAHEDATTGGEAGWTTIRTPDSTLADNGGAYALFLCQSGSGADNTGSLAAIWYIDSGSAIRMSGSLRGTTATTGGVGGLFKSTQTDIASYIAEIVDSAGVVKHKTEFNFDKSSSKFIRNVFNTNPQTVNSTVIPAASFKKGENLYWLGETFEGDIQNRIEADTIQQTAYGLMLALDKKADNRQDSRTATTGWFFSQDTTTNTGSFEVDNMQKLFRVHARDEGSWAQENLKVSIEGLRYSRDTTGANPFATFSLVIRNSKDNDNVVQVIERYSNCNINPLSENYIAKKVGTRVMTFDTAQRRLKEVGDYPNMSSLIRIEMDSSVENGAVDPRYLPFGVYGPEKFKGVVVTSGSAELGSTIILSGTTSQVPYSVVDGAAMINTGTGTAYSASLEFPVTQVRISASAGGLTNPKDAYFGLNTSTYLVPDGSNRFDPGYGDYLVNLPKDITRNTTAKLEHQWAFSLDDLREVDTNVFIYESGSRAAGTSVTAMSGGYKSIIDDGYAKFTAPLYDGFDGLNIVEVEPFRNTVLSVGTQLTNYTTNTVRRAIDSVSDPEFIECNMMVIPGMTDSTLTEHLLQTCEDRGDALAIIDIPDVYTPFTEGSLEYTNPSARFGSVSAAVKDLEEREINNSYGCTYYPWVQIKDTVNGQVLWAPPSIVSIGTLASSEASTELWFAPAGFNRGGLSEGSAGVPVLDVSEKLTSKNRDDLYEANINPIASFPNEGIVIFGQKTLQLTPSALDRINVRRMMIFVKKQISLIASNILFEQNVEATWNRFLGQAEPFLASVKYRLGLSEYKLVLDKATTTPDLVDQNIVYAKIFLKPAKAIEYIALDFVITNSGAGFED